MRLVTWNINSVRLRLPLLQRLMAEEQPDVICLQELKSPEDKYPADEIAAAGYPHQALYGMKGYNGVAILSRQPFQSWEKQQWCGKDDARHVIATLSGGAELHNFYIPAGGDIPDPDENEKFRHKLDFLAETNAWFRKKRSAAAPMILVGDLNIAPLEHDVWDHKSLLKIVSHTPVEVEALNRLQDSAGFIDSARHFVPASEKLYTWWSYRAKDWSAADKGRRLDHIWVTDPLVSTLKGHKVRRDIRGWEQSSDHAPVITDLDL